MAMEAAQRAEVGERIRQLRGPVPQDETARRLGVSVRGYQKWEAGESAPQWENLVRIAQHYGVTQDWVLYGRGGEPHGTSDDDAPRDLSVRLERIESLLLNLHKQLDLALPGDAEDALERELQEAVRRDGQLVAESEAGARASRSAARAR